VDEFGKGTLCADGIGLLCAALRHLAAQRPPCKLIACTHFSEVLDERYLPRREDLSIISKLLTYTCCAEEHCAEQREEKAAAA
jgi:DNA mismatch repair protein MSH5